MTIHKETKINLLLQHWPSSAVMLTSWLEQYGVSRLLLAKYKKSKWVETVGKGAFKRTGDTVNWRGGVYAIQAQAKLPIHVGGLTAVSMQGAGHYIRFKQVIQLFGQGAVTLPKWFRSYNWGESIDYYRNTLWAESLGLLHHDEDKSLSIQISSLERAILECLYLAPTKMDLVECYHILEGAITLRPSVLQELLEKCSSIKVKRLFLYMAEKANHQWFQFIETKNINLGIGKRCLVRNGVYNAKYAITVPQELAEM